MAINWVDRILGIFLSGLGILCLTETYQIWNGWGGLGSMPLIVGGILIILSVMFQVFPSPKDSQVKWPDKKEIYNVGVISGSFALYVILMGWLGFPLATWILLAALIRHISPRQKHPLFFWTITLIWTGGTAVGIYLIFKHLSVPLPAGLLGI